MQYAVSDIHGNYEAYKSLLRVINLKESDILYIVGDVVDYGDGSIKILKDMMMHGNIIPLLGEHEYMAYKVLRLMRKSPEKCMSNPKTKKMAEIWMKRGGEKTLAEFMKLDDFDKDDILDFFEEFSAYEEVKADGKSFVLVHGGFKEFDPQKPMHEYKISELLTGSIDPDREYFKNKYVVSGHMSTELMSGDYRGQVVVKGKNIFLDCGCTGKENIGCFRLEDGKIFYSDLPEEKHDDLD